jgi:ABC-type transporter Mla subunit MlaD
MLNLALHALLPIVKNDLFILGICVALSAWTVLSATKLYGATRRIAAAFDEGVQDVCREPDAARFMGAYEACSAALAKNTLLRPAWTGFSHTLIIPITPFRPILATTDARDCFDLGRLYRRAGADLRYHAALPGLLVGAGLLVTFLGLAAGLTAASDVVAEGATQAARNTALRDLLGAASVKFITSLVGLLLSIGYALFRKWQLRTAEHAQAAFLDALDERLPLRTPATLQADANLMAERQYAEVQRIGTDFFVNLGSILETKFSQGLEQHIGPLAAAIEKLSGKLANQNEDAMQGMLSAFLERLEGAIGSSMRGTAATLQTLGERLGGLQSGMDAAAQRMGRAAEEMAAGMGKGTQEALGGITAQMASLVSQMRDMADEAGRNNRVAGEDMARQMAANSAALTDAVAAFQRRMEEGAADNVSRLTAPITALLEQMQRLAEDQRRVGATASDDLAAIIGRAATALQDTAAAISKALNEGAADVSRRLVAATESMRDDLREVLSRFGAILEKTGEVAKEAAIEGGEGFRIAVNGVTGDLATAAAELRRAGEAAGAALRDGGADAQSGMSGAAAKLVQGSDRMGEHLSSLGTAAVRLSDGAVALEQATRAAAVPLASTAASLNEAGASARDAARPLQAIAEGLNAVMAGLNAAAASMAATQGQADALGTRLSAAAERFDRVDTSLASTLRALTEGLSGFQQQITAFIRDMDQGLARSVTNLTSVAKSLEETIEDFTERKPKTQGFIEKRLKGSANGEG